MGSIDEAVGQVWTIWYNFIIPTKLFLTSALEMARGMSCNDCVGWGGSKLVACPEARLLSF